MHRHPESNRTAAPGQAWVAYSYSEQRVIGEPLLSYDLLAHRDDPECPVLIFPAGTDVPALMADCGGCTADSTRRGRGFELRAYAWDDEPHGLGGVEVFRDGELEYDLPNGPPIKPDGVFVGAALLALHLADRPPQVETAPPMRYRWRMEDDGSHTGVVGDGWHLYVFPPESTWGGWHFDVYAGNALIHADEREYPGPRACQVAAERHFAEHYECLLAGSETAPREDVSVAGDAERVA